MLINAYMSFNIFNSKLMNHYTISMSSHKTVKILREQVDRCDKLICFPSGLPYCRHLPITDSYKSRNN